MLLRPPDAWRQRHPARDRRQIGVLLRRVVRIAVAAGRDIPGVVRRRREQHDARPRPPRARPQCSSPIATAPTASPSLTPVRSLRVINAPLRSRPRSASSRSVPVAKIPIAIITMSARRRIHSIDKRLISPSLAQYEAIENAFTDVETVKICRTAESVDPFNQRQSTTLFFCLVCVGSSRRLRSDVQSVLVATNVFLD